MKKFNKIIGILLLSSLLIGCSKTIPTLSKGEEAVVTFKDNKGISANELYESLKSLYGKDALINLIDEKILNEKYKETDEEKEYVNEQMEQLKSSAEQYGVTVSYLLDYYGMTEEQYKNQAALAFKRNKAVNDKIGETLTDKEIEKYYNENIFGQINCKHILIAPEILDGMTEEEQKEAEAKALKKAKAVIKKLNDKEDWDTLAKKYSDDDSNASKGGDLGWFTTGDMVKEFETAAFALKKGKYTTEPVKTTYGYHIIYKIDEEEKPTLKESKEEVIKELVEQKLTNDTTLYNKTLEQIRKDAGLEIIDSDLKDKYNDYMAQLTTPTNNQ